MLLNFTLAYVITRLFKYIKFQGPGPNARVVYIDGAFDLFHAGHVEVQLYSHNDFRL